MIYLDGSGNPQVNPTTSFSDVVIEPPSDEACTYKDEDPDKGHEEDPVNHNGSCSRTHLKESHVTMLNPLKKVFV